MRKTVISVLRTAWLLVACSKPAAPEEPVRAVRVLTVGVDAFTSSQEFAGEVNAQVESRLSFRVGGKIIKRQAELGQRVTAGQVLAQLGQQDCKLAAADYKRYKELKEQNLISGAALERRDTTLKSAQAQPQLAVQGNQTEYAALVADESGVVTAVEAEAG